MKYCTVLEWPTNKVKWTSENWRPSTQCSPYKWTQLTVYISWDEGTVKCMGIWILSFNTCKLVLGIKVQDKQSIIKYCRTVFLLQFSRELICYMYWIRPVHRCGKICLQIKVTVGKHLDLINIYMNLKQPSSNSYSFPLLDMAFINSISQNRKGGGRVCSWCITQTWHRCPICSYFYQQTQIITCSATVYPSKLKD